MATDYFEKNNKPEIIKRAESVSVKKDNGTEVDYFLFDKFEVHTNVIPAECVQDWHKHQVIEEILFFNKGSLRIE